MATDFVDILDNPSTRTRTILKAGDVSKPFPTENYFGMLFQVKGNGPIEVVLEGVTAPGVGKAQSEENWTRITSYTKEGIYECAPLPALTRLRVISGEITLAQAEMMRQPNQFQTGLVSEMRMINENLAGAKAVQIFQNLGNANEIVEDIKNKTSSMLTETRQSIEELADIKRDTAQRQQVLSAQTSLAQNAAATLSTANGYGLIRSSKAALDADVGLVAEGGTGTVASTDADDGNVYQRKNGAWQLITNVSAGSVSARRFGAGRTKTAAQNSAALALAMAFSAATGTEIVVHEPLRISETLVGVQGARLRCTTFGRLRPNGNFDVFKTQAREGYFDVYTDIEGATNDDGTKLTTWDSAGFVIKTETQALYNSTALTIRHRHNGVYGAFKGVGMKVDPGAYYISMLNVEYLQVDSCHTALLCDITQGTFLSTDGMNAGPWITGCQWGVVRAGGFVDGIVYRTDAPGQLNTKGNRGEIGGNTIANLQLQPGSRTHRMIWLDGTRMNNNLFFGKLWDGQVVPSGVLVESTTAPTVNGNGYLLIGDSQPYYYRVSEYDFVMPSHGSTKQMGRGTIFPQSTTHNRNVIGYTNNFLARADKRFTVSTNIAPNASYPLANAFAPDHRYTKWDAPSGDVVVEVDFGADYYFDTFIAGFEAEMHPQSIKLETVLADGTAKVLKDIREDVAAGKPKNTAYTFIWQHPAVNARESARKLRLTLGQPAGASIRLATLYAREGFIGTGGFLDIGGGKIFGNLQVTGNLTDNGGNAYATQTWVTGQINATPAPNLGSITFTPQTAASTANATLFLDSADGKLKFKDASGTVQALY